MTLGARTRRRVAGCLGFAVVAGVGAAPVASVLALPRQYRIASVARVLTIKTGSGRTVVVRNRAAVTSIAHVVDGLPVEPPPFCSEGSELGPPIITFTFRRSAGGKSLAQLSGLDDTTFGSAGCIPYRYTLHGHRAVFVTGGGSLITDAERVLHRSLR